MRGDRHEQRGTVHLARRSAPGLAAQAHRAARPADGRVGLTPNMLTLIGFGIAVVGALLAASSGGCWRASWAPSAPASTCSTAPWRASPARSASSARSWTAPSTAGARRSSTWASSSAARSAGFDLGAWLAAAAMGSAFMVSYTRARAESLGFSSGTGMAAVGLAPREVRIVILGLGLVGAGLFGRRSTIAAVRPGTQHPGRWPWRSSRCWPPSPSSSGSCSSSSQSNAEVDSTSHDHERHRRSRPEQRERSGSRRPRGDRKIRVAIVGVGNCASSLIQGRYYYEDAKPDDFVPGLMHVDLGGYHVRDIEFVAAFDVDKKKVGKDLSEAIYAGAQQHLRLPAGAQAGRQGRPGHDPRRPRQVPVADVIEKAPGRPRRGAASSRSARST